MFGLVSIEHADEVAAVVLEILRRGRLTLVFEQIIKQRDSSHAAGPLAILLGHTLARRQRGVAVIDEAICLLESIADEHEARESRGMVCVVVRMRVDVVGHCAAVKARIGGFELPGVDFDLLELGG